MNKVFFASLIAGSALLFTQCSGVEERSAEFSGDSISVTVSQVSESESGNFAKASGRLVSKNSINVSTRMMGYITSMNVQVGQSVSAGQQLVTIQSSDIQAKGGQVDAQIDMAKANLENAKKDYERFQNLFASGSATQKELDDMTTRYQAAQAGVRAAEQMRSEVNAQKAYTNISAPISGTITAKHAQQGDLANPGMPLLTIESSGTLQVQAIVQEQYITQISNGMKVDVTVKSIDKTISGTVAEISKSAVNTGGQYMVKINVPGSKELLPGMFTSVLFPFETTGVGAADGENIFIPESALVKRGQLSGVYVISSQGTAVLRWLKLGKQSGDQVEVLSGLNADEAYITSAEGRLFNGAKVNVN